MSELFAKNLFDLSSFLHASLFADEGYAWDALKRLEGYFKTLKLGVIEGEVSPNAFLVDKHSISIGKGTIVEPGAYIKGPCVIGKDSTVRHGAYVRGNLLAGNKCVIGHDSELKNAILFDGAHAPHFAYVGDSILGNHVNLGAGTVLANLRFDGKEVVVHHEGKTYPTGLRKLGAILGDNAETGCNSVTNPGTIFGKYARCWPASNVGGIIPAYAIARNKESCEVILGSPER